MKTREVGAGVFASGGRCGQRSRLRFPPPRVMPVGLGAQLNILTNRYDQGRTGANLAETLLTTGNVNTARFGRVGAYAVDGAVYAQPLYASNVTVAGRARNVLYVATMNDTS